MGASEWIAVVSIMVAVGLALGGGFVGWMISVVKNLTAIKSNTGHLATRIDTFEDTCRNISETLCEHSDQIGEIKLKVNTLEERVGVHRGHMGS